MMNSVSNSVNFKSTPLHYVNVQKVQNKAFFGYEKMVFSELKKGDVEDNAAVEKIASNWTRKGISLPSLFLLNFKRPTSSKYEPKYYAIEFMEKGKDLADRIAAIMQVNHYSDSKYVDLEILQSHPDLMHTDKAKREYKGFGEILLGECFKIADKNADNSVRISSSNNPFYNGTLSKSGTDFESHIGSDNMRVFVVKDKNFGKYINYTENEYGSCPLK